MKTISSRDRTTRGRMATARQLHLTPTPAEAALWEEIRNRRLAGLKFRRQHPWRGYVLDAFCPALQLAIEVDGGVHLHPEQARLDAERQAFLESEGIHLLRFRNEDVERGIDAVLNRILEEVARLTPGPRSDLVREGVSTSSLPLSQRSWRGEGLGMG